MFSSIFIGLWSEVRAFSVVHVVFLFSSLEMVEMSGEVGCWLWLVCSLVGVSVFSIVWVVAVIRSAISCPRWSVIGECHNAWCAFMSPTNIVRSLFSEYVRQSVISWSVAFKLLSLEFLGGM